MEIFIFSLPDYLRWNPSYNRKFGYVLSYDRACGNNCTLTDFYTGKNYRPGPDKNVVTYLNGLLRCFKFLRFHVMFGIINHNFRSHINMVPNLESLSSVQKRPKTNY